MKKLFCSLLLALTTMILGFDTSLFAQGDCVTPTDVQAMWIEDDHAYAMWNGSASDYIIYFKKVGDATYEEIEVSGVFFKSLDNLSKGTQYEFYIVAKCSEDNLSSPSIIVQFTTTGTPDCEDITYLPYAEDFESYGISSSPNFTFPTCWSKVSNSNTPNISSTHHSGSGGLYMLSGTEDYVAAVMPKLADNINIQNTEMTFWAKVNSLGHKIYVGVASESDNMYYFDTIASFVPTVKTWQEYTVSFKDYKGSNRYITFLSKKKDDGYGNNYYIDDITLYEAENNDEPNFTGLIHYTSELISDYAYGMELQRPSTNTIGTYMDVIGEIDPTKYADMYKGIALATFSAPIIDQDGEDFAVFSNNYYLGSAHIEVSSNGTDFFRFNNKATTQFNDYGQLFDLSELEDSDNLDKQNIRFIKIIDDTTNGYCLEGIAVINKGENYSFASLDDIDFEENSVELTSHDSYDYIAFDGSYHKDFTSGGLVFHGVATYFAEWNFEMSFSWFLTNITENSSANVIGGTSLDNTYFASASQQGMNSANYLSGYYSSMNTEEQLAVMTENGKYFTPNGVYVASSLAAYQYSLSKYNLNFKVIATGYDENGEILSSKEYILIDKESNPIFNPTHWRFMDLSSLGAVAKVVFTLTTTDPTQYIPFYFCIDEFSYTLGEDIPVNIINQEICEGESFMNKTESGTYTEGFTVLNLIVNPLNKINLDTTICANALFEFNNKSYTASQVIIDTIAAAQGCDTIYTINLTVADPIVTDTNITIEYAQMPFVFGNQTLYAGGNYSQTFIAQNGCDSTVNLHLTIKDKLIINVAFDTTICANSSFEFSGKTYSEPQTIIDTIFTSTEADTAYTINLTVAAPIVNSVNETIEYAQKPYLFGELSIEESGDYSQIFIAQNGCDSTVNLHLTINDKPIIDVAFDTTICANSSFEFNGKTYSETQTIIDTIFTSIEADTAYTINLTVAQEIVVSVSLEVLQEDLPLQFGDLSLTESGEYSQTFTAQNGCDSIVNLQLTVLSAIEDLEQTTEITIYPNPAKDFIVVDFGGMITDNNLQISVTNNIGQTIGQYNLQNDRININISRWQSGMYYVKYGNTVKKFVIE